MPLSSPAQVNQTFTLQGSRNGGFFSAFAAPSEKGLLAFSTTNPQIQCAVIGVVNEAGAGRWDPAHPLATPITTAIHGGTAPRFIVTVIRALNLTVSRVPLEGVQIELLGYQQGAQRYSNDAQSIIPRIAVSRPKPSCPNRCG